MSNDLKINPQMQNPNINPMGGVSKGKKIWVWVAVAVAIVVACLIWYFGSLNFDLSSIPVPTPTPEAGIQADQELSDEVNNLDLGDLDSEFKGIDADLNSL